MTPLDFADALRAYCQATSGSVTSWGRTPAHNKAVGGVTESAHTLWIAADVVYDVKLPGSSGGPVAFLMYPQAETGESRRDSLDPEQFRYTIKSREIAL